MRPIRPTLLALAAASLGLAACSAGGGAGAPASPDRAVVAPTTTTLPPRYALTGLVVDDPASAGRLALVVKIDNAPKARPQAGLEAADVVVEEVVEGGVTRFLAVFHSTDAPLVGPVRSVRPVDPAIVSPLGGLFAYSGGAPKFQALIRRAPVHDVGFDLVPDAYHRDRSRPSPNNMFTATARLWALADGEGPPPPLFRYREPGEPAPASAPALTGLAVALGQRTTADWDWDGRRWLRSTNGTPHDLVGAGQVGVENVVLQFADYRETGDVDVSGARVPEADIVGKGEAWVLTDGRLVEGRWSKPSDAAVTAFEDAAGAPIEFTPGRTWVSLVPSGAATTLRGAAATTTSPAAPPGTTR